MVATDTQQLARLNQSTELRVSDFQNAVCFRQAEHLCARPAQYGEKIRMPVFRADFTTGYKERNCNFGDMIIFMRGKDGQLEPTEVLPLATYNNRFREIGGVVNGHQSICELFRIARFHQDKVIFLGEMPKCKRFLLGKGGYAAIALRADGNHVLTPVEFEINETTGRPKIPARYIACDENGNSLCARRTIASERER